MKKSSQLHNACRVIACAFVFAASSAWATVIWDLNPGGDNAPVGSSNHTFTSSGYGITAYGWDNVSGPDTAHDLYFKNEGPSERGLGLVGTPNFELQVSSGTPLQYIQLDLTSILAQGFTNLQIMVGSVQSATHESFALYGSNALGTLGTQLGTYGSSFDEVFVSITNLGSNHFLSIAAASVDVLPVKFAADLAVVPEMNALFPTLGLLLVALSLNVWRERRRAQQS